MDNDLRATLRRFIASSPVRGLSPTRGVLLSAIMAGSIINTTLAHALVIFPDRSSWEAAVSGVVTEDLESDTPGFNFLTPYITAGGITLDTATGPFGFSHTIQVIAPGIVNDTQTIHHRDQISGFVGFGISYSPGSPFMAFAFDWDTSRESWDVLAGGMTIALPAESSGFFGALSATGPLSTFVLRSTASIQGGLDVDNISFAESAAAPEPSTLILIGSGLLAWVSYRRRR